MSRARNMRRLAASTRTTGPTLAPRPRRLSERDPARAQGPHASSKSVAPCGSIASPAVGADESFLWIPDYRPRHVGRLADLGDDRDRLRSLVGRTLTGSFAMWETIDDEWFNDGPVILRFDDAIQLEVAGFKFHICLSWDAIDVEQDLDQLPESPFRLVWRADALPALARLRGRPIEELMLVEYRGGFNGLGFRTAVGYAELFNALDELGIADAIGDVPETTRTRA